MQPLFWNLLTTLVWERSKSLKNIMRENGLRNEEIIRIIIIREYESYFRSNLHYWSSNKNKAWKKF